MEKLSAVQEREQNHGLQDGLGDDVQEEDGFPEELISDAEGDVEGDDNDGAAMEIVDGREPKKKKNIQELVDTAIAALQKKPCCLKKCIDILGAETFVEELTLMLGCPQIIRRHALMLALKIFVPVSERDGVANDDAAPNEPEGSPIAKRRAPIEQISYQFRKLPVCRKFFCALMGVSSNTLQTYVTAVRKNETITIIENRGGVRIHQRTETVRVFLRQFAAIHGLPNPSARGSREDQPAVFLDISTTRLKVFAAYKDAANGTGQPLVELKHFYKIWSRDFAWLQIATRKTDFCNLCTILTTGINRNMHELKEHLEKAALARSTIQSCIDSCITELTIHLTFDFAQSVRIPSWFIQPKGAYFQSGAIVDVFAVADDPHLSVWMYALPESQWPGGKDANSVCSMILHRLLNDPSLRNATTLYLQADNCAGQNKNQFLFKFFAWLVVAAAQLGLALEVIEINFAIAGHTKNFCDAAFGLFKRALNLIDAFTPADVLRAMSTSTKRTIVPKCGTEVQWIDVKTFVDSDTYFKPKLPFSATEVHHVKFLANKPGEVSFRDSPTDPWRSAKMSTEAQAQRLATDVHSLQQFNILPSKVPSDARRSQLQAIQDCWKRPEITVQGMLSPARSP